MTKNQLYIQHCRTNHTELAQGRKHRVQESDVDFLSTNTNT